MRRAVFLDRDGTLIRNHHYGCDPDAIELLDGVVEGLRLLKRAGYLLVVATNQSGIARAFFSEAQLARMHRRLGELLEKPGAGIDAFYYCPHHPDGLLPEYSFVCECRKPRPGMVTRACGELHIDPADSWFIGDILDDVEAGKRAGCRSILVDVGTEGEPESPERVPDFVASDFLDAVGHILRGDANHKGTKDTKVHEEPSKNLGDPSCPSCLGGSVSAFSEETRGSTEG